MNKQRFSQLVRHYGGIKDDDRVKLHELVKSYPYSQIIHTLIAKANSDAETDVAKQTLNYAALYTTDRGVLKNIIKSQGMPLIEEAPVQVEPVKVADDKKTDIEVFEPKVDTPTSEKTTDEVQIEEKKHTKVSVDNTVFEKNDISDLRQEIWEDLRQLEINKNNYLLALEEETAVKSKPTRTRKAKAPAKPAVKSKTTAKATTKTGKSKASAKTAATKNTKKTSPKTTTSSKKASTVKKAESTTAKKATTKPKAKTTTAVKGKAAATTPSKKKTTAGSVKKKPVIEEQQDIINKFIDSEPRISAVKDAKAVSAEQQDLSVASTEFGEDLISENLAQILLNQGKKSKAIEIYKKLIWKFPQKKSYFAALIEDLKK